MSILNKNDAFDQNNRPDVTPPSRLIELLKAYHEEVEAYDVSLHETHQHEQNQLMLERIIKNELKLSARNELKINLTEHLAIKVLANKPRAVIDSKEAIPTDYVNLRTQRLLDMKRIEHDLQEGKDIPGVHLEQDDRLNINIESISPVCIL